MPTLVPYVFPYGLGALLWLLWAAAMFRSGRKRLATGASIALAAVLMFLWLDEGTETGSTEMGTVAECKAAGLRTSRSCIVRVSNQQTVAIQAPDHIQSGDMVVLAQLKKGMTGGEYFVLKEKVAR